MKSIATETFSVSIPEAFQRITIAWESVRAEDIVLQGAYAPTITVGLGEQTYYEKFKGDNFATSFYNSCLEKRGTIEVLEDKTLPVNGKESFVRLVQGEGKYFHFFAAIPIDDEYCYQCAGDCELDLRETCEPLFEQVWQSLRYFGDPKAAMEKQKAGTKALLNKFKPKESHIETVASPEVKPFSIPEDRKSVWRVEDIEFEFLSSSFSVSPLDGKLYINLKGRAIGYDKDKHSHILSDHEDGVVLLRFSVGEVYQKGGVPAGSFQLEQGKDPTFKSFVWKEGFHCSLELYGTLTLEDRWLGFNGYWQPIIGEDSYSIEIYRKIPAIGWTHYRYTSLEEVLAAPPGSVKHLYLTNPDVEVFPDELYTLTELKTLDISYSAETAGDGMQLKEIPAAIHSFKHLTKLSLRGISEVTAIPKEIGELTSLENLSICGSQITTIPPEILQLPKLKHCLLIGNALKTIPGTISSSITSLDLRNNQLITVPEAFGHASGLTDLNIEENPLETLPDNIQNIKRLKLELEKKQQLLDYEYKGADGQGTVVWDDIVFEAKNDPELLNKLDRAIEEAGFLNYQKGLQQLALKAVALETTEPDLYEQKGNTRFGGLPDLPLKIEYPTFTTYNGDIKGLQFIGQLNCADLAAFQNYLPRTGIMYFFIEDQEAPFNCKMIYYDGDAERLQSAKDLDIDEEFIYDDFGIFSPYLARAEKFSSLPYFYRDDYLYKGNAENLIEFEEDIDYDELDQFQSRLRPGREHPNFSDTFLPVHGINNYVFTQHESPQIQAADKLGGVAEEWMVLLCVASENKTGFQFWDAGTIFFVIHKSDLAKCDFSNVYYGLESS